MRGRICSLTAITSLGLAVLAGCGVPSEQGSSGDPTPSLTQDRASTPGATQVAAPTPAAPATSPGAVPTSPQPDLDPISSAPATTAPAAQGSASAPPAGGSVPASGISLAGKVIALDPGHNGGNAANPSVINAQVPDGRGGTKACNTTGTATAGGYSEHAFNWDVAQRTASLLRAQGATVLLTRDSDTGVGPCIDERGTFGQDNGADILVSIHGDGSTNTKLKGYFAMVSNPPLNDAQGAPSRALAQGILDSLATHGFDRNPNFSGGLYQRPDMVGLNLTAVPTTMLELGEMKNPDEAAVMSSPEGRQRYAQAIADGISTYFAR